MKITPLLALGLFLGVPMDLLAQNFSGSDDFSSFNSSLWNITSTQNGGNLSVGGGTLNFTDNGLDASTTSQACSATAAWMSNAGSYTANWMVQIDLSLPSTFPPVSPVQFGGWSLQLSNSANSADYFTLQMSQSYGSATPLVQANIYGTTSSSSSSNTLAGNSVTVRVSYDATSTTLIAAYNEGSGFSNLWSVSVGAGGAAWNMIAGNTFKLGIVADHQVMMSTSTAVVAGTWTADNFLASPTAAVPEPGTFALLAGLAALALVWRRRAA